MEAGTSGADKARPLQQRARGKRKTSHHPLQVTPHCFTDASRPTCAQGTIAGARMVSFTGPPARSQAHTVMRTPPPRFWVSGQSEGQEEEPNCLRTNPPWGRRGGSFEDGRTQGPNAPGKPTSAALHLWSGAPSAPAGQRGRDLERPAPSIWQAAGNAHCSENHHHQARRQTADFLSPLAWGTDWEGRTSSLQSPQ